MGRFTKELQREGIAFLESCRQDRLQESRRQRIEYVGRDGCVVQPVQDCASHPSNALKGAQFGACLNLMRRELILYRPRAVVFLTESRGVVVAEHPQGRPESAEASSINEVLDHHLGV